MCADGRHIAHDAHLVGGIYLELGAVLPIYAPTARVKALELAFAYGFGRPAEQTPEFSDVDVHFTFNMRDTGLADTVEGDAVEDADIDLPAPPPGDS